MKLGNWVRRRVACAAAGCAALVVVSAQGAGTNVLYKFDTIFSANSVAPNGTGPWVSATFANATGGVLLTITNGNLFGSEKLDTVDFNLNPSLNVSSLTFTLQSQVGTFTAPPPATGVDSFKADGDGYYDIQLTFNTGASDSFMGGESVTYLIAGIPNLSATDFAYLSKDSGSGTGPFYAALHAQNTGANHNKSAWVEPGTGPTFFAVPEPGVGALAGMGLGLLATRRGLRRNAAR